VIKTTLATTALAFTLAFAPQAFAQEAQALPAACQATPAPAAPMGEMGGMNHETDEAHTALMAGMDTMNANMMSGAMNPDIDVAFVCGMIPHHQGAIDMARAELQYGNDEWTKAMAQKVINAQMQEIADMSKWLEEHTK
jgi:uncharacterized protein (DUF305 family)